MAPPDTSSGSAPITRVRDELSSRFVEALAFDDVVEAERVLRDMQAEVNA